MSCVYVHTNKINGKKYVGYSKLDNPESRWGVNGTGYKGQKFYQEGIELFGWDNFEHTPIISEIPITFAETLESLLIERLDLIKKGYNESKGICHESEKDKALSMIDNLINKINQIQINTRGLQTLDDIIESKYSSTTKSYRLEYMFDLYKRGRINRGLDCQREYVWDEPRQQGMWDTLLYRHRIPEIHAVRRQNGTYDIIDGKQRLLTLMKILSNEIPLKRGAASEEIKQYMTNKNIASIYFKDLSSVLQNKIYDTEIAVAEYNDVDEEMLVVLFQKLNAGKPLSEFQKCIANNIIVRIRYTEHFENNKFVTDLFSPAELSANEDEVMLVRLLSSLNCGDIENVDGLEQRNLSKIISKMDVKTLTQTREKFMGIIEDLKKIGVTSKELSRINKTWYPLFFKFFDEGVPSHLKKYFKDFIPEIRIPAQRGQESSKTQCKQRYYSIVSDWERYCKIRGFQ
jgi:hypothetical protein